MSTKFIIKIGRSCYSEKNNCKIGNKNMATSYSTKEQAVDKLKQIADRYTNKEFSILKVIEEEIKINL